MQPIFFCFRSQNYCQRFFPIPKTRNQEFQVGFLCYFSGPRRWPVSSWQRILSAGNDCSYCWFFFSSYFFCWPAETFPALVSAIIKNKISYGCFKCSSEVCHRLLPFAVEVFGSVSSVFDGPTPTCFQPPVLNVELQNANEASFRKGQGWV